MEYVSEEYIEGICEGRRYLNRWKPDAAEMRELLDNLDRTMKTFGAGPVKEMMKGERDFWKGQLKRVGGRG